MPQPNEQIKYPLSRSISAELPSIAQIVDTIRKYPGILQPLNVVPACWDTGVRADAYDISIGELVSRYYGIGRPKEIAQQIATSTGLNEGTLATNAIYHSTRIYESIFSDKKEPGLISWEKQVQEFIHIHELFTNPSEYFQLLGEVPIFNESEPPAAILTAAIQIVKGKPADETVIPRVKDFLIMYYGIGMKRKSTADIAVILGYSSSSYVTAQKDAILYLCNLHCESAFPIEINDNEIRIAEHIEASRQKYERIMKTQAIDSLQSHQPVARHLYTFLSWGLIPPIISQIINEHLRSIKNYGAPAISEPLILRMDQKLRGLRDFTLGVTDRAESAAIFLEKALSGKGHNPRPQFLIEMLRLIAEGRSVPEIVSQFDFSTPAQVYTHLQEIRKELEEDEVFGPRIRLLYYQVTGLEDLTTVKISSQNTRKIHERLLPLYIEYRSHLGDDPNSGNFTQLSPHEKQIITYVAQGISYKQISVITQNPGYETTIGYTVDAMLKPHIQRRSKDKQLKTDQEAYAILSTLSENDRWASYYDEQEQFESDLELMQLYAQGHSKDEILGINSSFTERGIYYQRDRIRAIVDGIKINSATVWKKGASN